MKKIFVLVLVTLLSIVLSAPSVMAAPPQNVHIDVVASLVSDPNNPDPFAATGPAVNNGLLCPTGGQYDLSIQTVGNQGNNIRRLRIDKRFICDDGSGTFDLRLNVRLNLTDSTTTARWRVIDGTEAYSGLRGHGTLTGDPNGPGAVLGTSIFDVYDGRLN